MRKWIPRQLAHFTGWTLVIISCCLAAAFCPAWGAATTDATQAQPAPDIKNMSLEDLMNIDVTTVSKKSERLDDTAAAVYVITQEDIRRSGFTHVADLLRMVPGMQSAHIDANKWAVGARGFAERFEKMLLVLVDGRSVYLPSTSGVDWLAQDMMLENIDRIEVVRGPGGTIWGANAVNGVINIITKKASAADGQMLTATGFSGQSSGAFQMSGRSGADAAYRVSAQSTNNTGFDDISSLNAEDGWNMNTANFRVDRGAGKDHSFTLEANALRGEFSQTIQEPSLTNSAGHYIDVVHGTGLVSEANMLARWSQDRGTAGSSEFQVYYDRFVQDDKEFSYTINVTDFDYRAHLSELGRHDIVWGGGARFTSDRCGNTDLSTSNPLSENNYLLNLFVQDEIKLLNKTKLILGSKLEYTDQTRAEWEPTARLLTKPSSNSTVWASASRAVRMPSWMETHTVTSAAAFPGQGGMTYLLQAVGDPDLQSETLVAYETGYRIEPTRRLSFDLSAFRDVYNKLRGGELEQPTLDGDHMVMPLRIMNNTWGTAIGLELAANWSVTSNWRLAFSYSRMHSDFFTRAFDPQTQQMATEPTDYGAPDQFQIRSYMNLRHGVEFDTSLNYTASFRPPLSAMSYMSGGWATDVPSYWQLDARVGWQVKPGYELSIIGQNLLKDDHLEFRPALNEVGTLVPRAVFVKGSYSF